MRGRAIVLAASLFSVIGLLIPSHFEAEAAGPVKAVKIVQLGDSGKDLCANTQTGLDSGADCNSDSKTSKIDLDRKGHKVKKSKSRGR